MPRANGDAPWANRLIEEGDTPLTVAIYDEPSLLIDLEHDPARLSAERAGRLADHLVRLMTAMADAPAAAALDDLSMLSADESRRVGALR